VDGFEYEITAKQILYLSYRKNLLVPFICLECPHTLIVRYMLKS
jgi:hypothetical protein